MPKFVFVLFFGAWKESRVENLEYVIGNPQTIPPVRILLYHLSLSLISFEQTRFYLSSAQVDSLLFMLRDFWEMLSL